MKCPNCNTEFDWGKFCPNCGTECVETPEETGVRNGQAADMAGSEVVQPTQPDQKYMEESGRETAQEMVQNPYQNPYQQMTQSYQQPAQNYSEPYQQNCQQNYQQQYQNANMPVYTSPAPPMTQSGMGIASLVLGITSLTGLGAVFIPAILGLIFGIVGKQDKQHKTELATVGIILSAISIVLWIAIYVWVIGVLAKSPYLFY